MSRDQSWSNWLTKWLNSPSRIHLRTPSTVNRTHRPYSRVVKEIRKSEWLLAQQFCQHMLSEWSNTSVHDSFKVSPVTLLSKVQQNVTAPYIRNRSEPVYCRMTVIVLVKDQRPKQILPVTYWRSETGENTEVMSSLLTKESSPNRACWQKGEQVASH